MTPPSTNASSYRGDAGRTDRHGVRMAWFEHGTSRIYYEAQGRGDPVLMLPGVFLGIEEFSSLRDALVAAGYRCVCGSASAPGEHTGASNRIQASEVQVAGGAEHFVYRDRPEWLTDTILDWMGKH